MTDPDVTRFFMTVEEAVGLVLSAAPMGEFGETFVLDMGEPVRIVDLVRRYAEQLRVPDVQIQFTGLRPGEKLHETLFGELEERLPTVNPAISATRPGRLPDGFASSLELLYADAADGDDDAGPGAGSASWCRSTTRPRSPTAADGAGHGESLPGRILMRAVLHTAGERVERDVRGALDRRRARPRAPRAS